MMFKKRQRNSTSTSANSSTPKPIIIEDLSTDLIPINGKSSFCILIHNLLDPTECHNLIRRADDEGFDDALVQGPDGKQILRQDIRSCGRCIIDDAALADAVYVRILNALRGNNKELEKKFLHAPWVTNGNNSSDSVINAVGLNERMRFLKYSSGHFFGPHRDLRYTRGPYSGERAGETSHITVQLYLNEKFKGGTTRFLCGKRHYDVKPKLGSALIFDHDLLHEGSRVVGGTKYSVRTDVMFTSPSLRSQKNQQAGEGGGGSSGVVSPSESSTLGDRDPLGIFTSPQA